MHKFTITFLILCFTILSPQQASAGDFAKFRSLGFSPDGSYFAFEQFYEQDGSGFPFAERYIIDVKKDTYVKGTPFRVLIEDEDATVGQARKLVADQSSELIKQLDIRAEIGRLVAFNPSTELSVDPHKIVYRTSSYEPPALVPYEVSLETFDTPTKPHCADMTDGKTPAFRLNLKSGPDGVTQTIYEDKSVPDSRNCPISYNLGGVIAFYDYRYPAVQVFLVLARSYGFEGPDGNWIAIPKIVPEKY